MIREFWIENYLSIRERQTMNFETEDTHEDWMSAEVSKGVNVGCVGIIFGANASGKSNMLKGMLNIFELLFIDRKDRNEKVYSEMPFALAKDKPTKMYVSFFVNGIRYDYTISYLESHIIMKNCIITPTRANLFSMSVVS